MIKYRTKFGFILAFLSFALQAQNQSNEAMQTFSPYTPEQLRAFNAQKLSPTEGSFGPVGSNQQQMNLKKKLPMDSKFFNIPAGEQEAEALETESVDPYEPITPAMSF